MKCVEQGYCFNVCLGREYRDTNSNVEICEAVTRHGKDEDGFVFKDIPKGLSLLLSLVAFWGNTLAKRIEAFYKIWKKSVAFNNITVIIIKKEGKLKK